MRREPHYLMPTPQYIEGALRLEIPPELEARFVDCDIVSWRADPAGKIILTVFDKFAMDKEITYALSI